jgi:aspartate-semialdehyde dehydrogenase
MERLRSVAVLGATGLVGREMIKTLEERDYPVSKLRALASPRSAGSKIVFRGTEITVEAVSEESFKNIDIALFSAGGSTSKKWAPVADGS